MTVRALLRRRERPPEAVLATLTPDERVVSWADAGAEAVVATQFGLWWPEVDGPRLIRWQHIDKATWHDDVLTVIEAEVVDDFLLVDREPAAVALTRPRDLPPTVRKRIEQNIVRTELLTIAGGAVRFVGRRRPGHDGVVWWARLEPGTPDGEQLRAAIRARLAILRASESRD
ncbi:hypothetical protein [uncultured Jatrophihabitans sp.]|uniref:hypothetical protein n=1 Tax=uncultured Jatrophihabitans sp. TaxID=1610747 RepID=UPI0035CA2072